MENFLQSPLNYTGSKYKLLSQLLPYFPKTERIIDIFTGGGSVMANVDYPSIVANDIITPLIQFYQWLQTTDWTTVIETVKSRNIPKDNQEAYLQLRERFNQSKDFIDFFILVSSCTNNMMRFNKSFLFNQTWGKRNFNSNTEQKLMCYHKILFKNPKISFVNGNFYDVPIKDGDFVYLDPPYTDQDAGYNAFWSRDFDVKIFDFIDQLNSRGIRFMLSGTSKYKGVDNPFIDRMKKYNIHNVNHSYNKVSRSGMADTQEIFVINY